MDIITTTGVSKCQRTYVVFSDNEVFYLGLGNIYTYINYLPIVKSKVTKKLINRMYSNSKILMFKESNHVRIR